jgi:hypothetical protein
MDRTLLCQSTTRQWCCATATGSSHDPSLAYHYRGHGSNRRWYTTTGTRNNSCLPAGTGFWLLDKCLDDMRESILLLLWRMWFVHNNLTQNTGPTSVDELVGFLLNYRESLMLCREAIVDDSKGKKLMPIGGTTSFMHRRRPCPTHRCTSGSLYISLVAHGSHLVLYYQSFSLWLWWWVFIWYFPLVFDLWGHYCSTLLSWRTCSKWCCWTQTLPSHRNC